MSGTPGPLTSPEKMKNSLEKKAKGIRSQTMTFANDGIELSLNVPDSADVREAFGSVIETVVEQQTEIGGLNTNLDKVNREHKVARKKLVDATSQRLQQLLENQMRLESQLQSAQREIKNFTYNIQGYVDESQEDPVTDTPDVKEIAINAKDFDVDDDISIRSGVTATLYPTETGAPAEGQISFKTASVDGVLKKRKPKKKDKSSLIYYSSVPKRSFPADPRGRWKWAFKKVLASVRMRSQKISLSRTRLDPKNTLISRIELMDKELFELPGTMEKKMKQSMEQLLSDVTAQMKEVKEEIKSIQDKADERAEQMLTKITAFEDTVKNIDKRLSTSIASLEDKHNKLEVVMQNNINELRHQLKDAVSLDLDRLRLGLNDLNEELTTLDKTANGALTDLKSLIIADDEIKNSPPQQVYEQLIEKNASIQQFRSTVAVTEACCDILNRNLSTLKRDVNSAHHHYNQKFLGAHSIVSRDEAGRLEEVLLRSKSAEGHMKVVRDTLNVMKGLLKKHDANLTALSQEINGQAKEATKSFPAMKAQLEEVKTRTQSLREDVNSSQEDLGRMHKTLATIQRDTQDILQKYGETNTQVNTADMAKELATLKIQMDAIRTMLFDKVKNSNAASRSATPKNYSRPTVTIGEEGAEGGENGDGQVHSGSGEHGGEGGEDGANGEGGERSVHFSGDHHPDDHHRVLFGGIERPRGEHEGGGISSEELYHTVTDILNELLPDLLEQLNPQGAAAMRDATAIQEIRRSFSNRPRPKVEREMPNQMVSQGFGGMGGGMGSGGGGGGGGGMGGGGGTGTMAYDHHPTHPHGQGITVNTTLPGQLGAKPQGGAQNNFVGQGGGGPVSIASAIKQVQQVFSEDGGDSLRSSFSRPGGGKTPTRNRHGGSVDVGSPSHRGPIKRPQGGLRGSFDSAGSRMGSFAMNEYSTSSNFDASFLINDIAALRAELMTTKRKLDLLDEEKVTRQLVEKLCGEALAEQRRRDNRTDYRSMIEDADKSIRELVHEMILLKRSQEQGVESIRDELHKAMDHTVKNAIDSITDNLRDAVVSTKALCLGCGRTSVVKTEPTAPSSPQPFFPHLSASSLPGPDVLRAGFKMPVRASSPPPDIPLLMKGKVAYDTKSSRATTSPSEDLTPLVSPMAGGGSMTDTDFDDNLPKVFPRDEKLRPMTSGGELQSRIDPLRSSLATSSSSERLRPIFRKGFPARKSLRAEMNFAPERFELGTLDGPGRPSGKTLLQIPAAPSTHLSQGLTTFAPIHEES